MAASTLEKVLTVLIERRKAAIRELEEEIAAFERMLRKMRKQAGHVEKRRRRKVAEGSSP